MWFHGIMQGSAHPEGLHGGNGQNRVIFKSPEDSHWLSDVPFSQTRWPEVVSDMAFPLQPRCHTANLLDGQLPICLPICPPSHFRDVRRPQVSINVIQQQQVVPTKLPHCQTEHLLSAIGLSQGWANVLPVEPQWLLIWKVTEGAGAGAHGCNVLVTHLIVRKNILNIKKNKIDLNWNYSSSMIKIHLFFKLFTKISASLTAQ